MDPKDSVIMRLTCTSLEQNSVPNKTVLLCKYKLKQIPEAFLASDLIRRAFLDLINHIELSRETQENVDSIYDQFCNTLIKEMNTTIPSFDCSKRSRKRYNTYKFYWNNQLESLWKDMRQKEYAFTKYKQNGTAKRRLQLSFKTAQNSFYKALRNAERSYKRDLSIDIETACTDNPRKFWDHLRSLGPKRKHDIPFEMYDDTGNITSQQIMKPSSKNGLQIFHHYTTPIKPMSVLINISTMNYYEISVCSKITCLILFTKKIFI